MDTLIKAICRLAAADMQAMSNYVLTSERSDQERFRRFWHETLLSRGRFVQEFTEGMIELLDMQRRLMVGQMDRLSRDTGRVALELAHNTERSVAIATKARQQPVDRRVFSLPLPLDRRGAPLGNRRASGVVWEHPSTR